MMKTKPALKILYVTQDSRMYGANQSLLNLLDGLGKDVVPCVLVSEEGPLLEILRQKGIRFLRRTYKQSGWWYIKEKPDSHVVVFLKAWRAKILNFLAVKSIVKELRAVNFDVVHSNSSVVNIGVTLSQKLGCRHVWHFREFQDLDHGFYLFEKKDKFIEQAIAAGPIIAITSSVARHFQLEGISHTIFDGVRPTVPDVVLEKQCYFIFCGAVKKQKGIEEALRAFALLIKSGKNIPLKIVGGLEHNYRESFFKLVKELDLDNHIEVLGFRNDVDELIRNAKALLMCSKNEAMGRVTVEAMLLGCPVIGFDSQGTAELIDHGRTGYLYTDVSELAGFMNKVLEEEKETSKIIMAARSYALDHFLDETAAKKVLKVYERG